MADDPDPLLEGRYRLLRKIGVGGMAAVYVAEDSVLDREVAVKRLHADSPEDAVRRFRREAHLAAGLSHPNLVSIFDAFCDRDELVVVMEYVPGADLSAALKHHPPSEQRGLRILAHLAAAIDHVHGAGIVHRDIKPSNVLLSPDGERAKLTDLGIARVIEDTATTQAHAVPGSVPYMSPEQLSGEVVGPPSDIYSFALVAYEVLSGRRARTGTGLQISSEGAGSIPDIRDVRPQTPPAAAAVLREAMARDPQQRLGNAAAIVDRLRRALEEDAASTRTASTAVRPISDSQPREGERGDPALVSTPAAPSAAPARAAKPDRRRLTAMATAALIVAALVAVLVASGGDERGSGGSAGGGQAEAPQAGGSAADGDPAASADGGVTSEAVGAPARALQDFYAAAAEGDLEAATALASPALEAQLGGPQGVASTFSTLETISFERIGTSTETAGRAEVEFETTAEHTDRTERCSGRANLLRDGGDWLVDRLAGVSCEVVG